MKRDMELARAILLRAADKKDAKPSRETDFDGYDPGVVGYNIYLLCQAGLLDGSVPQLTNEHSYRHCMIGNLTWSGNDFIEAARQNTVWERTKTYVTSKGLEMTFGVAQEALKTVTMQMLTNG